MLTVTPAEGPLFDSVVEARCRDQPDPHACLALARAQRKTSWGSRQQRRFALMDGDTVLASARRTDFSGTLDSERVNVCCIDSLSSHTSSNDPEHGLILVGRLVEDARLRGASVALLPRPAASTRPIPDGFEIIPTTDVELRVTESSRHGAPMTLVRGGEDRDLAAIVSMGEARARPYRFHLDRDVDLVKYAIATGRLRAGLSPAGTRQLDFVIAEEGITAAAYLVISRVGRAWALEECGDRDPSGARAGALLQALIAREPAERRPVITGWLPPGFLPPQVSMVSQQPSTHIIWGQSLSSSLSSLSVRPADVLLWRGDFA